MDPTERFHALFEGPEESIALDELALLVAWHAEPLIDIDRWIGELDDLAERCQEPTFAGVVRHVAIEGYAGNRADYFDPRNSYLHHVIERRTGIPLTLSIVTIEVGRRLGVPIVGVGLPGHFLVRDARDLDAFADPFETRLLDRVGCRATFEQHHAGVPFDDSYLVPTGNWAIAARMLGNLKSIHLARRDRRALAWVLALRVVVPGVPLEERRELASALAADGRFSEAADALERMADLAGNLGEAGMVEEAERGATRLRARLN